MSDAGLTRRGFLRLAGAGAAIGSVVSAAGVAFADPQSANAEWIANHVETRLIGADGQPVAGLPMWTRMRIVRGLPNGFIQVWVPRFGLYGRVAANAIGPVPAPARDELAAEQLDGPTIMWPVDLPARVVGGGNLRTWPAVGNTLLRTVGHNTPLQIIDSVVGDEGDEWYRASLLDGKTDQALALGYIHNSLVRLPRLPYAAINPDRQETPGRHFEADLKDPAMLTAFEDGVAIWSTLTLKGTVTHRTPSGIHRILWRIPNETMSSERVYPPIPRDAPGGYYLKNVLFTQYFTSDGASIHYNYWSSNWGYAGSHGCLGVAYNEAKFAWDWADVGTPVYVFT
jgi:hypothetical protein